MKVQRPLALSIIALVFAASPLMEATAGRGGGRGGSRSSSFHYSAPRITGYTSHGLHQAIGRNNGRGVSIRAMHDALHNPMKVTSRVDSMGRSSTVYRGRDASVALNPEGRVVTTYPHSSAGTRGSGKP